MWKRKHWEECAVLRGNVHGKMYSTVLALLDAQDFRGIVDLTVEATKVAADCETVGNLSTSADIYGTLADGHEKLGTYEDAIGLLNTALPILEKIRTDELTANCKTIERNKLSWVCTRLAVLHRRTGLVKKACVLFDRALVIGREAGDRQCLGNIMTEFGHDGQCHTWAV